MIPQAAPGRRFNRFRKEIDEAIAAVLDGDQFILGGAVDAFEQAFATYIGSQHCIGVASGTDAIAIALRALGVGPGSEVITSALTFAGTAQAILHCGATPRFVDVDPATRCIEPSLVAAAITSRTRAIVPVHLFGFPCDMPKLQSIAADHGLVIVEDCAQSHGAMLDGRALGTFSDAAAFSFYPTKNLGCLGDGGAILCNDDALAGRIRKLRNYGISEGQSREMGFNSRLDEIQAAILLKLLSHLDDGNRERRSIGNRYRDLLAGRQGIGLPPDAEGCVYHQFAITVPDRDQTKARLAERGIGCAVHYSPALHQVAAFRTDPLPHLTVAEYLADNLLSLPIQPEVALEYSDIIAHAILEATAA